MIQCSRQFQRFAKLQSNRKYCQNQASHILKQTVRHTSQVKAKMSSDTQFSSKIGMKYPPPVIKQASASHTSTVFMMHGLGDTPDGWYSIAPEFSSALQNTKFVFPHAPTRPITLNGGFPMTGWYDIRSLDKNDTDQDKNGLMDSLAYIESLINKEIAAGIDKSKIIVMGFSMGGAMSLMMLRSQVRVGGIVSMSGYLPLASDADVVSGVNSDLDVLMCHGTQDTVVQFDFGQKSAAQLNSKGIKVELKTYPMSHSACPEELQDVLSYLKSKIG